MISCPWAASSTGQDIEIDINVEVSHRYAWSKNVLSQQMIEQLEYFTEYLPCA
jgi:hypothetical protein